MRYQSILIHVGDTSDLEQRVQLAAHLAKGEHATVIGLATTGNASFPAPPMVQQTPQDATGASLEAASTVHDEQDQRDRLRLAMTRAMERFTTFALEYGIPIVQRLQIDNDAASALSNYGNNTDLIILGRSDLQQLAPPQGSDLVEFVTLNTKAPVLMLNARPFAWRHALIAWNSSAAAARATRHAIGMLQEIEQVSAVIFGSGTDPATHTAASSEELQQTVAALGKPVELIHRPATADVGHALLALAEELGADLIVMGCVAHPRWRSALLGGATGVMLAESPVSLLLSA